MKKVCLKNGQEVIIREPKKEDAQSIVDFYNVVGGETDFLSFGKNEFKMSVKDYEKFIEDTALENNSTILVATVDDKIISIATIGSSQKARTRHVGEFGIVIAKQFCDLGLGRKFMEHIIEWANSNGITKKISLVTSESNDRAIALYKKFGFEEEGILKKDNYVNGVYCNTIMMGLIL